MKRAMSRGVVLVTGAAGGIGYEIVRTLVADSYRVVATDTAAALHRRRWPSGVDAAPADLLDATSVSDLGHHAKAAKVLNVVHCAGYGGPFVSIENTDLQEWHSIFSINVASLFALLKHLLPSFKAAGHSHVIAISSIQSLLGSPGSSAYVASKHALNGFIKTLAAEYGKYGVCANAICPGYIKSPMGAHNETIDDYTQRVLSRTPSYCQGAPSDISALVAFLLCGSCRYINGSIITVDGGITADVGVVSSFA